MEHSINKTLIIRLSSIGDIILTSPLVRVLRKNFPAAQIDFLVKEEYADLLRHNPHLSRVITLDTRGGLNSLRSLWQRIHQERYDLIIDIHGNFRSTLLRTNNAQRILTIDKRKFARFLLVNFKWNLYPAVTPVAQRYLETLRPFGIEDDGEGLEVFVSDEAESQVRSKLAGEILDRGESFVGLCPGARHETKRWPEEHFAHLALALINEGQTRILLFGGEEDRHRCASIVHRVAEATGKRFGITNLAGELSILETAAAMDLCDLIVTNDTGLLHLASARKRKVVAIFGPTVKEFGFFPFGMESKVFERNGLYCRPCTHIGGQACPEGHFRCMKEISPEDVFNGVKLFQPVAA